MLAFSDMMYGVLAILLLPVIAVIAFELCLVGLFSLFGERTTAHGQLPGPAQQSGPRERSGD